MTEHVDPETGEVTEGELALVPLNIADLDEEHLLSMFPTPVQCAGALLIARERLSNAPDALQKLGADVRKAKRELLAVRALVHHRYRQEGWGISDSKELANSDEKVMTAIEAADDAELALEYGRELRRTLTTEVDILRSLNANFRGEHRG